MLRTYLWKWSRLEVVIVSQTQCFSKAKPNQTASVQGRSKWAIIGKLQLSCCFGSGDISGFGSCWQSTYSVLLGWGCVGKLWRQVTKWNTLFPGITFIWVWTLMETWNKGLVIFRYFNAELLHIIYSNRVFFFFILLSSPMKIQNIIKITFFSFCLSPLWTKTDKLNYFSLAHTHYALSGHIYQKHH